MGDVRVSVCGRTDRGVRRQDNQDSFLVLDLADPASALVPSNGNMRRVDFTLGPQGAVLLVADGMGGRAGGARASDMTVAAVRDTMLGETKGEPSHAEFASRLERALEIANAAIHEDGKAGPHAGMGSTATLAGLIDDKVYVAQVGDSRAYLVRREEMGRLTRDQSLVQDLIDSGILEEGEPHPGDNMILQALGPTPRIQAAVTHHELRKGDVLLLCSDGLSGVVRDEEIRHVVSESTDCAALCDRLVDLANERGGPDNITVIAAWLEGGGMADASEGDVPRRQSYGPGAS